MRQSPPYEQSALDDLRAANARLHAARADPAAAIAADDDSTAR